MIAATAGGYSGTVGDVRDLRIDGEIDDLLAPYRAVDRRRSDGRPWVLANMVAGLDGSAATGGRVGPLSEGADSELFLRLRSVADVVLVGAETVRRERYGPVELSVGDRVRRSEAGRESTVPIAVVSASLDLDPTIGLFARAEPWARPIVVTGEDADAAARRRTAEFADVVTVPATGDGDRPGAVDPGTAIAALGDRGHRVILCEGGPRLLGQLVAANLLDELCLTLAPVMGGDDLQVAVSPPGAGLRPFDLVGTAVDGSTLLLRYEARREAAT